jgi:hypothetical protein
VKDLFDLGKWLVALASAAYAWVAYAEEVPLLGVQRTPFVPGASVGRGGNPLPTVDDRSRSVFARRSAKSAAFPRTGVPFTVSFASAEEVCSSFAIPRRPPAHAAPTFSPGWGEC